LHPFFNQKFKGISRIFNAISPSFQAILSIKTVLSGQKISLIIFYFADANFVDILFTTKLASFNLERIQRTNF